LPVTIGDTVKISFDVDLEVIDVSSFENINLKISFRIGVVKSAGEILIAYSAFDFILIL
jgi:hypothetical protein